MEVILPLLPLGFVASSLAIGLIGYGYVTAVGRNPEASRNMSMATIFAAFCEAIAVYCLVIALMAKFV